MKVKKRIFRILETADSGDTTSRIFDVFIISLISLNLAAVVLETVKSLSTHYSSIFRYLEICSVTIFTIEYVLRLWSCTTNEKFGRPISGRTRFAVTPLLLIDLAAILPFYLPMFIPLDLRFLRALRLVRIFRTLKMARYSESLRILGCVFRAKKEDLILTAFIISILLILASSFIYFTENTVQPEAFSSIPQSMWWGVATLTTVGYGDVYPVTTMGKILGAIVSVLGIGMFALPAGILSSGFTEELRKRRTGAQLCPHCGGRIES